MKDATRLVLALAVPFWSVSVRFFCPFGPVPFSSFGLFEREDPGVFPEARAGLRKTRRDVRRKVGWGGRGDGAGGPDGFSCLVVYVSSEQANSGPALEQQSNSKSH